MPEDKNSMRPKTIPYLPDLKGDTLPPPKTPGEWQHNKELLRLLGEDLDIRARVDWSVLTAIPTIFARPLLFAEALLDPSHPLHSQVENEWRGLLALICFKEYQRFNIDIDLIDLERFIAQPATGTDQFIRAMQTLLPKPEEEWRQFWRISVGGVMLGATSPKSLVFAAAEYDCPKCIPWVRDGRLCDPVQALRGRQYYGEAMNVLKTWVANLNNAASTAEFKALDSVHKSRLTGMIGKWHQEIPGNFTSTLEQHPTLFTRSPYTILPGPVKDTRGLVSDFLLAPKRPGAGSPLLVTPEGWKMNTLRVFGDITPDLVEFPAEANGEVLDNGRIAYKWIRPDLFFFTPQLMRMRTVDRNTVLYNNDGFVPPLRQEILDYYTPDDLADVFHWEPSSGGGITCSLHLRTTSGQTLVVTRTYPQDKVIEVKPPPFLEVWPNFRAANWKHYYVICSSAYQKEFDCYPFFPGIGARTQPAVSRRDARVWKTEQMPDAVVCRWDGQFAGLIPIHQPDMLGDQVHSWRAAVDFGTSNTSVFFQTARGEDVKKLTFSDRSLQITDVPTRPRNQFLYGKFFAPAPVEGMFPSHLKILEERGQAIPEPALDGIILFVEPSLWASILEIESGGIKENLKWAEDDIIRKYIATFNKQLLLMIAAEGRCTGAKDVEIRFSYPSAFSERMLNQLRSQWGAIVTDAREKFNIDIKLFRFPDATTGETESAAACKYLLNERGAPVHATDCPQISMDVGGGTTDIAIWIGGKLAVQCSLLLGGRELSAFAKRDATFRKEMQALTGLTVDDGVFREHADATFGILMKLREQEIAKSLAMGKSVVPCFKRTRTMGYLIFAGAFYYTGMLLRHIASKGHTLSGCDVYLAGNGARLIDWVSEPAVTIQTLKSVLLKALAPDVSLPYIDVKPAVQPKEEVARGLIYDYGAAQTVAKPVALLCEEGYRFDGRELHWYDDIYGAIGMMDLQRLQVPAEFPQLKKFLDEFNRHAENLSLNVLDSNFVHPAQIRAKIQQAIARIAHHREEALIQPFFVEAVRQLLARLHEAPLGA